MTLMELAQVNTPRMTPDSVRLSSVSKVYGSGDNTVAALCELSLRLAKGSYTAVMGPSGSGKSTFLHCAAGLDRPTSGAIHLADVDLGSLNEDALSRLRRERIGFVFQSFNLVPSLTAAQNITLPLRLAKQKPDNSLLIMLAFGLTIGTIVAIPGLAVLSHDLTGSAVPSVPLWLYGGLVLFYTALAFAAGVVSTRLALRMDPVRAMAARE
jgi:ABC-type dipeptide/oligopeptide/nickel transport system ATPase component